ncbi:MULTISPECIES: homing endonuclease associated repeat-containing protein [Sphingobacterium]|uniref:homing endonuclease associated repeat-containing protein n=1 Tax=Sphingobacterium TaxID=28453 RepID=UPI00257953D1|nr:MULTISPECIES: hypothetical protein [Sphingobacterium]
MKQTQEDIIAHAFSKVREFHAKHGRTPVRREMEDINTIARRYFGAWNKFILAAGLKPNTRTKEEITAKLLALVSDFYEMNGRIPMRREFSAQSSTINNYFGSWNKFIAAAGFAPNDRRIPSIGKLKNSLVKFYLKHGRSPNISDCTRKNGLYNPLSYYRHLHVNSWADVLEYVKLKSHFRVTTMTADEAKEKVIKLIKKHRIKYYKDYKRLKPENYPSVWYLKEKFGWNNLCYLAGTKIPITKFSIRDYYLSLAKELGRAPTTKELEAKMGVTSGAMVWKTGQRLNRFIESFGQKPAHSTRERCRLSKKQLAELYKSKSIEHGYPQGMPRSKLMELTGYSRDVYELRFFSMNGLRLVCGFKLLHSGNKRYTEEELRNILKMPRYR